MMKKCLSKLSKIMKAIETTATINESGQLTLDQSLGITKLQRVRVIVLIPEDDEVDPNETPTEIVIEGIRQGLYEALTGQTIPLSEMWEGIDAE
ncbi:conserved hypothetical protein [Planktothrix serta PCC 8927]|uniref:Uncharacterized protein n=2 Tax=Planktothrix TaxID=54304 RepID=A0A7Z9DVJ7_9CYAN|nr:conserved hypothetical protein [Planktothrix serta PCC 8927]